MSSQCVSQQFREAMKDDINQAVSYRIEAVINTDAWKRNALASKLRFPVGHHLGTELLVEWTGVRQEASGQQDIADKSSGLRLKALACLRPTYALSRQTVN